MSKAWTVLALLLVAPPALADMDYLCLKNCVNSGAASRTCMAQCSYGVSQTVKPAPSLYEASHTPHDQFTAPLPSNQILVHPQEGLTKPSKDYGCMSQCQQNGYQYQLCDEQCTTLISPSSSGIATQPGLNSSNSSSFVNSVSQPAGGAGR